MGSPAETFISLVSFRLQLMLDASLLQIALSADSTTDNPFRDSGVLG